MNTLAKNLILFPFNLLYKINPELELKLMFRLKQGYSLDLKNPETFSQKLQWIKLYDRNELMPLCCDKYTVRGFVEEMGCGEILNELYWHGSDPENIPYDTLPDQFVIKVTHGSTFNILVKDKSKLDRQEVSRKIRKWLKADYLACYGEWFYGKVPPRIIVEKYLEDENEQELRDYKVFCFNGKAKLIDVHSGRFDGHKRNLYDLNWNFLEDVSIKFEHGEVIPKPAVLEELLQYAEMLSKRFLHARVDFFIVNGKIYFGEITFTSGAGFSVIRPHSFDVEMGNMLELPLK